VPDARVEQTRVPAALWRMAFAAGLASYLDAATIISVSISLPIWRDHFALGVAQVGLLTAGLAFAIAVGSIVGGWLGDRLGRGPVFTYDLVVFVIGTILVITAVNGTTLTAGVIIVGLAAGADVPTSVAVIADAAPERARGRLVGLTQTMWIAGILATFALGFAVSTLGFLGTQILIGHIVVLAVVTLGLRLVLTARSRAVAPAAVPGPSHPIGIRPRDLVGARVGVPLLATGLFFAFWNIASATLGNYGTYFLVNVTGLSQSGATGLALLTFPPALLISLAFVRLADTVWRDRLFVVAMVLQIAAFTVGALTGGTAVLGMVLLIFMYSLSNVFAGEAIYKVWSQRLFPARVRASALGVTYGLARAVAAAFMFVVPLVIERYPNALLWILAGCVTVSGAIGLLITHHPRLAGLMRLPRAADGGLHRTSA
jgi:MFS transporter, SP family, inositol transporter